MALSDIRQEVLTKAWLDTGLFAEQVEVVPDGLPARTGVAAHVRPTSSREDEEDLSLLQVERIEVLFSKDDTDTTTGGVSPREVLRGKLQIRRAAAKDPDRRPWVFTGEVTEDGHYKHRLIFERPRIAYQGGRG